MAAILYRFYTEHKRIRFDLEVRWLIARPVIGIIMSAVAYLAIRVGILILNRTPTTDSATAASELEVYWVIAFLAGFSDKFYLRIIDLLVGRTVGEKADPNIPAEQKEKAAEKKDEQAEATAEAAAIQSIVEGLPEPTPPPANHRKRIAKRKSKK